MHKIIILKNLCKPWFPSYFVHNLALFQRKKANSSVNRFSFWFCSNKHRFFSQFAQSKRPTIFALSTSPGVSAVAIIRISGPNAQEVAFQMANFKSLPAARMAVLRKVRDPETKEVLDQSLMLWFPSPSSYTGEDMCELHVHGSIAVIQTVLKALAKLPSFQHAEPGEFTKRAFMAGKLDLTEIEGLSDLLHAQTEAQQRQALLQMEGHLFKLYNNWAERIKNSLARIEAYIDFSEDQNLEDDIHIMVSKDVDALQDEMRLHLSDCRRGEKLRNGLITVLVGQPNVGKSSLINAICQRDIAIVSHVPGTTRDVIESSINLGGYLVHLSDTAGIRECQDVLELEGVKRTYRKLSEADILLYVMEAKSVVHLIKCQKNVKEEDILKHVLYQEFSEGLSEDELLRENIGRIEKLAESGNLLLVLNKIDLLSEEELRLVEKLSNHMICPMSCLTGLGLSKFLQIFTRNVENIFNVSTREVPALTQERHRMHIEKCLEYLSEYEASKYGDAAIAAENLRKAAYELGKITGKITTDDILTVIFRDFCIGK